MRSVLLLLSIVSIFVVSCGTNKKENDDAASKPTKEIDTMTGVGTAAEEPKPIPKTTAEPRSVDSGNNDKHEILANIDQYLISKPSLANATLTVENTLKDATIIKAYAEVTIVDASGKDLRKAFLILENIQPANSKVVKIPDVSGGATIVSHIVRLKSDELTNGEAILVGSRYTPK